MFGIVVQGGFYVTPKLELYGRWEFGWWKQEIDEVTALNFSDMSTLEFGVNYYLQGQDVKWSTDIGFGLTRIGDAWANDIAGWRVDTEGAEPQIVIRTQLQLMF